MNTFFQYKSNTYIFTVLMVILFSIKLFDITFAPNHVFPGRVAVFSWIEFSLAILFGYIGLKLYEKLNWPDWLQKDISNTQRLLFPMFGGVGIGLLLVLFDYFVHMGDMNVGWPLSRLFYLWGGIFSELVLHLFLLTFFVWLFSSVILRGKHEGRVFWIIASCISLFSVISMLGAVSNPDIPLSLSSVMLMPPLALIIFMSEILVLFFLRRYGFLAALTYRLSFYLVWHILWGGLFY